MGRLLHITIILFGLILLILTASLPLPRRHSPENLLIVNSDRRGDRAFYTLEPDSRFVKPLTRPYRGLSVWRTDNTHVYFMASDVRRDPREFGTLYRVNIATRHIDKLIEPVAENQLIQGSVWLGWITAVRLNDDGSVNQIYRVRLDGSGAEDIVLPDGIQLPKSAFNGLAFSFTSDAAGFLFTGRAGDVDGIFRVDTNWQNARLILPMPDFEPTRELPPVIYSMTDWLLVWRDLAGWLWMRPDGSEATQFMPGMPLGSIVLALPEGQVMLTSSDWSVWSIYDLDTPQAGPLWSVPINNSTSQSPGFLYSIPGGEWYIFVQDSASGRNIFRVRYGENSSEALTDFAGNKSIWALEGEKVIFGNRLSDGRTTVYEMASDGSALRKIVEIEDSYVVTNWNVVDDWLFYSTKLGSRESIYRVRVDGSEHVRLTDAEFDEEYVATMPMFTREWQPFALGIGGFLGVGGGWLVKRLGQAWTS